MANIRGLSIPLKKEFHALSEEFNEFITQCGVKASARAIFDKRKGITPEQVHIFEKQLTAQGNILIEKVNAFFNKVLTNIPELTLITKRIKRETTASIDMNMDVLTIKKNALANSRDQKIKELENRISILENENQLYLSKRDEALQAINNIPTPTSWKDTLGYLFTMVLLSTLEIPLNIGSIRALGDLPAWADFVGGFGISVAIGFLAHLTGMYLSKKKNTYFIFCLIFAVMILALTIGLRAVTSSYWWVGFLNIPLFGLGVFISNNYEERNKKTNNDKEYLKNTKITKKKNATINKYREQIHQIGVDTCAKITKLEYTAMRKSSGIKLKNIPITDQDLENTKKVFIGYKNAVVAQINQSIASSVTNYKSILRIE